MFHVSFLCFNSLKIKRFKRWNIGAQCFIFGFNVSFFIYHAPFQKTQWEKNQTPMGAIKNLNGREIKPQWEKHHWNIEIKNET